MVPVVYNCTAPNCKICEKPLKPLFKQGIQGKGRHYANKTVIYDDVATGRRRRAGRNGGSDGGITAPCCVDVRTAFKFVKVAVPVKEILLPIRVFGGIVKCRQRGDPSSGGYSSASCSPAELASASPAEGHPEREEEE